MEENILMVSRKVWREVGFVAQPLRGIVGGLFYLWNANKLEGREIKNNEIFCSILLRDINTKVE